MYVEFTDKTISSSLQTVLLGSVEAIVGLGRLNVSNDKTFEYPFETHPLASVVFTR